MVEAVGETSLAIQLAPCASTLVAALRACLGAAGDDRDLAEITGLTGLAFHLNLDPVVSTSSVAAYPWAQELPQMVSRLGYELQLVYSDDEDPRFAVARDRALTQIIDGLWRGAPSILWGVHLPEFGVVRGFRAGDRVLLVSGVLDGRGGSATLPYDQLGRGDVPILLAATLGGGAPLPTTAARMAALRHAVRHARGVGPRLGGFTCGLAGYQVWRHALDSGEIDPAGHGYALRVVSELRAGARPFVQRAADECDDPDAAEHLRAAAAAYGRSADRLIALSAESPFPPPDGYQLTATMRTAAIDALRAAADAEEEATERVETALDSVRRRHASAGLRVELATADDAGALFHCVRDIPIQEVADAVAGERARVAPELGGQLQAWIARAGDDVVGHLYCASLAHAGAPIEIDADPDAYLYLYCPWVAADRRHSGIGARMMEALVAKARADGIAGVFTEATYQDVFLHVESLSALGFEIVDRDAEGALMYLAVTGRAPRASIAEPPPPGSGPLRVVVGQRRPCPLLACARANMLAGARAAVERGARLDVVDRADGPNEITVGPRRLPLSYVPAAGAEVALIGAADEWSRITGG